MSDWYNEANLSIGQIVYLVDQCDGIIAVKVVGLMQRIDRTMEAFVQRTSTSQITTSLDSRLWAPSKEQLLDYLSKKTLEWQE